MDLLSGAALAQVQQLIRDYYGQVRGERPEFPPVKVPSGPEVLLALIPSGGIPALDGIQPGNEECEIYRARPQSWQSDIRELEKFTGPAGDNKRRIYNASSDAVPEGIYAPVWRDKFGTWWASPPGTPSSGIIYQFANNTYQKLSSPTHQAFSNTSIKIRFGNYGATGSDTGAWTIDAVNSDLVCVEAGWWACAFQIQQNVDTADAAVEMSAVRARGVATLGVALCRMVHPKARTGALYDQDHTVMFGAYEFEVGDTLALYIATDSAAVNGTVQGTLTMMVKV